MSIGINYANTSLMTQNHTVINAVNKKVIGCTGRDLKAISSGTLKEISPEELEAARKKKESVTYICEMDHSAIMNSPDSGIKAVKSIANSGGGSNTIYNIDGVTFTGTELNSCREVMRNAAAMLRTKGSSLDYVDYASMGITANMVSSYGKENLTKEQAEVVNRSMEEYLDSMVQAEQETLSGEEFFIDTTEDGYQGAVNKYYNVRCTCDREMFVQLRNMFLRELGPEVGAGWIARLDNTLERIDNGVIYSAMGGSATNKDLTSKIKSLFADVDLYDETALSEAYKQYWKLMKPVYDAVIITNPNNGRDSIAERLREVVNSAASNISNAKAVIENVGRNVNCSV